MTELIDNLTILSLSTRKNSSVAASNGAAIEEAKMYARQDAGVHTRHLDAWMVPASALSRSLVISADQRKRSEKINFLRNSHKRATSAANKKRAQDLS